jgi:hypothetical protein
MKKFLFSFAVLATLVVSATPAHAYRHCYYRHHHRICHR